jgi:hypothetical protein
VRQTINLNDNDAKRQMVAGKTGKILPQVELGELMIGDGSGLVDAPVLSQSVPVAVSLGGKFLLVKTLDDAGD